MEMIAPRTGAPEVTLAEDQLEYAPLTVAVYGDNAGQGPRTVLSRWRLSEDDRNRILCGEDVYIGLVTFGHPMQPIRVQVGADGWTSTEGES